MEFLKDLLLDLQKCEDLLLEGKVKSFGKLVFLLKAMDFFIYRASIKHQRTSHLKPMELFTERTSFEYQLSQVNMIRSPLKIEGMLFKINGFTFI